MIDGHLRLQMYTDISVHKNIQFFVCIYNIVSYRAYLSDTLNSIYTTLLFVFRLQWHSRLREHRNRVENNIVRIPNMIYTTWVSITIHISVCTIYLLLISISVLSFVHSVLFKKQFLRQNEFGTRRCLTSLTTATCKAYTYRVFQKLLASTFLWTRSWIFTRLKWIFKGQGLAFSLAKNKFCHPEGGLEHTTNLGILNGKVSKRISRLEFLESLISSTASDFWFGPNFGPKIHILDPHWTKLGWMENMNEVSK